MSDKPNPRIVDWLQWDWTRYLCEHSPYCPEMAKTTPIGVWCLKHYMELNDCSIEGCHDPVPKEHQNQGQGLLGLCRKHLIDEDPDIIESQRYDMIYPKSNMVDIELEAPRDIRAKMKKKRDENGVS